MAMKAGRRPDLGERRTPGEVRPVTNRLLTLLGLGVLVLVAIGTAAVFIASSGDHQPKPPATNVPTATHPPHSAAALTLQSLLR